MDDLIQRRDWIRPWSMMALAAGNSFRFGKDRNTLKIMVHRQRA